MTDNPARERPPIMIAAEEADALSELAVAASTRNPAVSRMLLEEIDRADLVERDAMPADVVGMGSPVTFAVEDGDAARTVTLVYPAEADIEQGRVSILTPVGAGLLGLRVGQTISWPTRNGEERLLRIEAVERP